MKVADAHEVYFQAFVGQQLIWSPQIKFIAYIQRQKNTASCLALLEEITMDMVVDYVST